MIVLDLETAALPNLPEPGEGILAKGCGNLKDPKKIEAKREENRETWIAKAPLDWRTGQVVAFGYSLLTENLRLEDHCETLVRSPSLSEKDLLGLFWTMLALKDAKHPDIVGFNIRSFDLWFLRWRSRVCGVKATRRFNRARFREDLGIIDWAEILADWDLEKQRGWKLEDYARFYNFKHQPVGSGSEVPARWARGEYQYVADHLRADVLMCRELHEMFWEGP